MKTTIKKMIDNYSAYELTFCFPDNRHNKTFTTNTGKLNLNCSDDVITYTNRGKEIIINLKQVLAIEFTLPQK